ncbi:MAG TPA: N-acyl-D-amino acid deacylase [Candidatus Marinimicrobia bacterium]|nr:N-acyl-D-amino acid deacylase [Candidatus Neomarinimicrobiota bacterium]HIB96677.1 N-acyl-D-amino acid deacylase [Candidatus Neomarinimicrobiota bacterium]HIC74100.1 N-acyl-D-amino acid deacylase [Candidatus Neomarinimicrobiota bacterium]HIO88305.1 N-acyl-D-amino acid deacylase [Candidatus Neomarinimicrobiota bacterium]
MFRLKCWGLFIILFVSCTPKESSKKLTEPLKADLWIQGGTVVDGGGGPAIRADVFVNGDSILFVGTASADVIAKDILDATDLIITPGFIDAHAHGDPFDTPGFTNFLSMGVTTLSLGQDGFSPDTEDLANWMKSVDTLPLGPNIAMFVGHSTLRKLSGVNFITDPSEADLEQMGKLLEEALTAGAFGMTTGLEYTPGTYANQHELDYLARIVGTHEGLIMSHVRKEQDDTIEDDLAELFSQGRYANIHVSHMKVVFGKGVQRAEEILMLMTKQRNKNLRFTVTADVYPYLASYTTIGILFPDWAKPPHDYEKIRNERREELLSYVIELVLKRNGPVATLFGTEPYRGKTLAEVSEEMDLSFEQVLVDSIGPAGADAAYFTMDKELQERFLADPYVMVSSDGSPAMYHPRGHGAFAKMIRKYVVEDSLLTLEEVVRKMTALPAETIGLTDRGLVRKGYKADLIIFNPLKVKDNATFGEPHQLATGFETVIVNGNIAWQRPRGFIEAYGRMLTRGENHE